MGYFSWLKADSLTEIVNIASGLPFKCLIPKQFDNTGKGFIKDIYRDYGFLGEPSKEQIDNPNIPEWNKRGRYDLYELLAIWNKDYITDTEIEVSGIKYPAGTRVGAILKGTPQNIYMKEIDKYTDYNREIGVAIGCYDRDIEKLNFPLKLVSPNYNRTYEQCMGLSYGDPSQGCRCLRKKFYEGGNHRYDGIHWHDVYLAWQAIERMRFDKNKGENNYVR